jgi:hypothetical protein
MDKKSIDAALDHDFKLRHWQRIRLCSMPPAFARDIDVSPFFLARPLRRSGGAYAIDGYLGVVCQPFERAYLARHGVPRSSGKAWNPIWLCMHIANISDLREAHWIGSEGQIPTFCERVANYLEQMPHTVQALGNVVRKQELLSRPLESFAFARPEKLRALQEYFCETPWRAYQQTGCRHDDSDSVNSFSMGGLEPPIQCRAKRGS